MIVYTISMYGNVMMKQTPYNVQVSPSSPHPQKRLSLALNSRLVELTFPMLTNQDLEAKASIWPSSSKVRQDPVDARTHLKQKASATLVSHVTSQLGGAQKAPEGRSLTRLPQSSPLRSLRLILGVGRKG
jgi:hypothetical protein